MGTINDLKKISSKRLLHKAASWLQKTEYRYFHKYTDPVNPDGLFGTLRKYRATEARISGPRDILLGGNSRMHAMEFLFESLVPNSACVALSGDWTDEEESRLDDTFFPYQPKIIFDEIGGNNVLRGEAVSKIIEDKKRLYDKQHAKAAQVFLFEICPLGPKLSALHPEFNDKIREINAKTTLFAGPDNMIAVTAPLTDQNGVMRPEFNAGDDVHHSVLAYLNVYMPGVQEKLLQVRYGAA